MKKARIIGLFLALLLFVCATTIGEASAGDFPSVLWLQASTDGEVEDVFVLLAFDDKTFSRASVILLGTAFKQLLLLIPSWLSSLTGDDPSCAGFDVSSLKPLFLTLPELEGLKIEGVNTGDADALDALLRGLGTGINYIKLKLTKLVMDAVLGGAAIRVDIFVPSVGTTALASLVIPENFMASLLPLLMGGGS